MDTITYEKQEDGSILKTVTHKEESRDLDEQIFISQTTIDSAEKQRQLLEEQITQVDAAIAAEKDKLTQLETDNKEQEIPDIKILIKQTVVADVDEEIRVIQKTLDNLKAGATDSPKDQESIDELVTNLEEQLLILQAK